MREYRKEGGKRARLHHRPPKGKGLRIRGARDWGEDRRKGRGGLSCKGGKEVIAHSTYMK
jgi:hypothetical protein